MAGAPEYSDVLRALGRFLDEVQAFGIEIVDEGDEWIVAWNGPGLQRLERFHLEALREVARMNRGLEGDIPRFTTSQMLRVLGTVLEDLRATQFSIKEIEDGYRLSALVDGKQVVQAYTLDQLQLLAAERLQQR
ncbi:MAG TPA: hypothetical protein VFC51_02330 [Chloroflexota bacterium]|nr:hypothetical protein [Chloroflexota bacterium]